MLGTTAVSSHLRRALGVALVLLVAGPSASALALDAPELLYREGVSENEPGGPWLPLDGARIAGLGFIVGTRVQARPAGESAIFRRLTALAVPDGHPDQGPAFDPATLCNQQTALVGTEIVLGVGRFEGPGSYTVKLEQNVPSAGATNRSCSGGPATTATFTIDPTVTLDLLARGPTLLDAAPFAELVRVQALPAGGRGQLQCARDAIVQADGSLAGTPATAIMDGSLLLQRDIPRAGRWTCVARAVATVGQDLDGLHFTRWSAPVSFAAMVRFKALLTQPDNRRPRFTLTYGSMPAGSEGAAVTLRISPGLRCPRVPVKTLRATVSGRLRVSFTFTLPEKDKADLARGRRGVDYYGWRIAFTFAGTPFVRASVSTKFAAVFPARSTYAGQLVFGQVTSACVRTG